MKKLDRKKNIFLRLWEFVINIYHKKEEMWNYLIVGVLTTIVSLTIKWILLFTVCDAKNAIELQVAIVISWIISVLFAYITNRIYVFKSKNKNILSEIISFFTARLLTLLMEMFIMWFLVTLLSMNSDFLVTMWTIITQILVIALNYVLSKLLIFKK